MQLFTKYKLENREIEFILQMQSGIKNWKENSEERKAYAEFMRGLKKLMELNLQVEAK